MACQFARAIFGPSVSLLTVIGAQRQNAALAVAALAVLAISNAVLAPLYGVLGAAIAVAIATLFWLVACAVVLGRVSGQDRRPIPARKVHLASLGAGLAEHAAGKPDGAVLLKLLLGLLGCEQRGPEQPEDKGRNGQKGDGGANFAEM
jgi:O-antigen/teichoic acid export membrane protein